MLTRHRGSWIGLILLVGFAAPVPAQTPRKVPLAPTIQRQVWEAMVRRWNVEPIARAQGDLQVLRSNTPLPSGARLRAVSARAGGAPGVWLIRLDCEAQRDCLPFFAVLRKTGDFDVAALAGPVVGREQRLPAQVRQTVPLQHAGDRVEVVEELSGMHLKTKAVCLEAGAMGDRIRVRNVATHRILLATVFGENRVRVER